MHIESMTLRNYRVFRDIEVPSIPTFSCFVGANGTGKSTLFDVFAFLKDALSTNVSNALARRGGFREVLSRGEHGNIRIELKLRSLLPSKLPADSDKTVLVTYVLEIALEDEQPIVAKELLKYRRGQHGKPWHFIDFARGQGYAVINEEQYDSGTAKEERKEERLSAPDILALKGLGQFRRYPIVSELRSLIEGWHLSDFHVSEARPSQETGYAEHLTPLGDNLAQVARTLHDRHPNEFRSILQHMKRRVPGVSNIDAKVLEDGRLVLRFQDGSFKDPFVARYVSDGTIKMFAYLVLLYDPRRTHPLLCVEEPENQLYPNLLHELAEEFQQYANRGGQVFASTHSPDFLNACPLEGIYILSKDAGFSVIRRAADDPNLVALVESGDLPGALWKQGAFHGADPA